MAQNDDDWTDVQGVKIIIRNNEVELATGVSFFIGENLSKNTVKALCLKMIHLGIASERRRVAELLGVNQ